MRGKPVEMLSALRINRTAPAGLHPMKEVFSGPLVNAAVRKVFGNSTNAEEVLGRLKVEVLGGSSGYMWVEDEDGRLVVVGEYLRTADERSIYLDLIHEMVHIRQLMEGKDLYNARFSYVDRPTELEAYKTTIKEARRLGMGDSEIREFLRVEWVSEEEHKRLIQRLGLSSKREPSKRNS